MNRDSTSPPEDDNAVAAQRAAALEDVRLHVEAGQQRRAAAAQREELLRPQRPRNFWTAALDSGRGFWYEIFGERLVLFLGLAALWLVISSIFWLTEAMRWPFYLLLRSLDIATGAAAVRAAPFLAWTLWGGVFGGCLGYWLVAPLYGDRENRSFVLLLPLFAMLCLAAILWAFWR